MNRRRAPFARFVFVGLAVLAVLAGCSKQDAAPKPAAGSAEGDDHAPTNRIPIPAAVRANLGITFAKVETRAVAAMTRYPGRFDAASDARREYRAPVEGRLRLAVRPMTVVKAGDELFRIDALRLRDLRRSIAELDASRGEAAAKLDGMPGFRAAHERHEAALLKAVDLWKQRTSELEAVVRAGGGRNEELTAAKAGLASAEAAFSETIEKDADMAAREREWIATRDGLDRRLVLLREELASTARGFGPVFADSRAADPDVVIVRAEASTTIERVLPADGAWVAAGEHVVVAIDTGRLIFRSAAPQADLVRLAAGGRARIVSPSGGGAVGAADRTGLDATFALDLVANAEERTIGLLATLTAAPPVFARPGVVAALEITPLGGREETAVPRSAVLRDGLQSIFFRRDPADRDRVIRVEADTGADDGRWIVLKSGVREGDEVVVDGAYQLMLAGSGSAPKGGHFHADGTFHADEDHK